MPNFVPTSVQLTSIVVVAGYICVAAGAILLVWSCVTWLAERCEHREIPAPPPPRSPRAWSEPAAKGFDRRSVYELHANDVRR